MENFRCTRTDPVVRTKQGDLRGFFFDGTYRFWGVPYAKAARFEMPTAPDKWKGVRNAIAYGRICPILRDPVPDDEICVPHRFWPESEHCQNLNIWTDSLDPAAKKPVMVWFHGGGFSTGSAIEHIAYEGDSLAKKAGVVLVSVNHRLNAFGHQDLSMYGEKFKNSVNVGIADLVESLRWVRDNIASFGGDPNNVTIFGQSGGGGKVTALGQTAECDGLFHKAIIMSGIFDFKSYAPPCDPKELADEIMRQLRIPEGDVEKLQKVNAQLFIMAVNRAVRAIEKKGFSVGWGPKANYWYAGDPREVGFRDHYLTVPTYVGTVLSEFCMRGDSAKQDMPQDEQLRRVKEKYGKYADDVLRLFRAAYPGKNDVYACDVDTASRAASKEYVRLKAKGGGNVYSYMMANLFDYDGGRTPWHCADIPFAFANSAVIPYCWSTPARERLEAEIAGSFVNFAHTGDPNGDGIPCLPPCTPEDVYTLIFDDETRVGKNYDDGLTELLKKAAPPFVFHFRPDDDEDEGAGWIY